MRALWRFRVADEGPEAQKSNFLIKNFPKTLRCVESNSKNM
jgi:hypothetical protein